MAREKQHVRKSDIRFASAYYANPLGRQFLVRPFKAKKMPVGRSLLLELPPEIRTLVYEFINDEETFDATVHRGVITDQSPLLRVSKLIRQEYEGLLYTKANVHATVTNFDFSPLVRLINRLEETEFHTLTKDSVRVQRKFVITILLTNDCPANPEKLHSWLYRFHDDAKRGCQVDFQYEIQREFSSSCYDVGCSHDACIVKAWLRLRDLRNKMRDQWLPNLPKGRLRDELVKICDPIAQAF